MLGREGPEAAMRYLQEDLQKGMNLSRERAVIIDQAIMQTMPQREITLGTEVEMVDAAVPTAGGEGLTSVQDRARRRAQARADSVSVVRDRATMVAGNIYSLLELKRATDAARLFAAERNFLAANMERGAFNALQLSVNNSVATANTGKPNKHKLRAEENMNRIYALLGNNDVRGAHKMFKKNRKHLSRHLDNDRFKMLEITVTQSFNHLSSR
jgi:hypothetical protein